jgi:pyridoxal phosphate enzyme (YggS family)
MLQQRLRHITERIAAAASRAGRSAGDVRLMAVTKTHPRATVEQVLDAGIHLLGENRVQEAMAKFGADAPAAAGGRGYELHLIGHLQRNKAAAAAGLFDAVQSIDKLATAEALSRARPADVAPIQLLLELNTSGEVQKGGCSTTEELLRIHDQVAPLPGLLVCGVMTMAPFSTDRDRVRECFSSARQAFELLGERAPGITTLSMGMSGDFEIAIEEGATLIRIGSALLGPRPPVSG